MAVSPQVLVQAYTDLAPRYERQFDRELRACWGLGYSELADHLVGCIPLYNLRRVLDLCTGTARIPIAVAARAPTRTQVVGLDITPAMLLHGRRAAQARGLEQRVRMLCASALVLPFGSGSFDVVTCALAWQYLDAEQALSEIRRVLRPGGALVMAAIAVPPSWRNGFADTVLKAATRVYGALLGGRARSQTEATVVSNLRTAAEWNSLLRAAGLVPDAPSLQRAGRHFWYPGVVLLRAVRDAH